MAQTNLPDGWARIRSTIRLHSWFAWRGRVRMLHTDDMDRTSVEEPLSMAVYLR